MIGGQPYTLDQRREDTFEEMIAPLSWELRRLFRLRFVEGRSIRRLAADYGVAMETVRRMLRKGIGML